MKNNFLALIMILLVGVTSSYAGEQCFTIPRFKNVDGYIVPDGSDTQCITTPDPVLIPDDLYPKIDIDLPDLSPEIPQFPNTTFDPSKIEIPKFDSETITEKILNSDDLKKALENIEKDFSAYPFVSMDLINKHFKKTINTNFKWEYGTHRNVILDMKKQGVFKKEIKNINEYYDNLIEQQKITRSKIASEFNESKIEDFNVNVNSELTEESGRTFEGVTPEQKELLNATYKRIDGFEVGNEKEQGIKDLALISADVAYSSFQSNDTETASTLLDLSNTLIDIGLGITPGVGLAKDVYELFTGRNLVTGELLSDTDKTFALIGVLTVGLGSKLKVGKNLYSIIKKGIGKTSLKYIENIDILNNTRNFISVSNNVGINGIGIRTREGIKSLFGFQQSKNKLGGASNAFKYDLYKRQLRQTMAKPVVQDSSLKKIMNHNYRDNAKVGSGSTADAVRIEKLTGKPVGGKWHEQKARNQVDGLKRWLQKNPNASNVDRAAAEQVMLDLMDALGDI